MSKFVYMYTCAYMYIQIGCARTKHEPHSIHSIQVALGEEYSCVKFFSGGGDASHALRLAGIRGMSIEVWYTPDLDVLTDADFWHCDMAVWKMKTSLEILAPVSSLFSSMRRYQSGRSATTSQKFGVHSPVRLDVSIVPQVGWLACGLWERYSTKAPREATHLGPLPYGFHRSLLRYSSHSLTAAETL